MEYQYSERKMENMVSNITRKFEECCPIGWQKCFIFYNKGKMDKIKYYPKMQNGAVISEVTQHMDAPWY
ncbi:hypothetical protein glysoja_036599 [Glycine soja]|uniref:Uncharacterized protein n=1 Tax=Glycine soja TaxID=3848 RepID=A0A0B2Q9K4_GLYSO|nr:hypothetical protein glysoja_036599 [Glycine soja]